MIRRILCFFGIHPIWERTQVSTRPYAVVRWRCDRCGREYECYYG